MADGYLEKKMEDYLAGRLKPSKKKTVKKTTPAAKTPAIQPQQKP